MIRWLAEKLGYVHLDEVEVLMSSCANLAYSHGVRAGRAEADIVYGSGSSRPYGSNTDRWLPGTESRN